MWRWLLRLREAEAAGAPVLDNYPRLGPTTQTYTLSARQAAWVLIHPPEALKPIEQDWLAQMQARCPLVKTGQALAQQFIQMVKTQSATNLSAWLQAAEVSDCRELQNFAVGLRREYDLIEAALTLPWSAGQTEGQVHRLKLIKRQMYGRAKFDLLRQRVLHRG